MNQKRIRLESGSCCTVQAKEDQNKGQGGRAWQAIVHGVAKSQIQLSGQAQHKRDGEEGID